MKSSSSLPGGRASSGFFREEGLVVEGGTVEARRSGGWSRSGRRGKSHWERRRGRGRARKRRGGSINVVVEGGLGGELLYGILAVLVSAILGGGLFDIGLPASRLLILPRI